MFMIVAVLTIADCARNRTFTWTHGLVLIAAGFVTLVAGIDGGFPR